MGNLLPTREKNGLLLKELPALRSLSFGTILMHILQTMIMHTESPDKKPIPGNDLTGQVHDEHFLPEKTEENKEQDLDDLVHNNIIEEIPEDEEFDADEAIHHLATHPSVDNDSEKDPDDLVHGN